jgi:hypothetical protein
MAKNANLNVLMAALLETMCATNAKIVNANFVIQLIFLNVKFALKDICGETCALQNVMMGSDLMTKTKLVILVLKIAKNVTKKVVKNVWIISTSMKIINVLLARPPKLLYKTDVRLAKFLDVLNVFKEDLMPAKSAVESI